MAQPRALLLYTILLLLALVSTTAFTAPARVKPGQSTSFSTYNTVKLFAESPKTTESSLKTTPPTDTSSPTTAVAETVSKNVPIWLDPGTKGGVVFLTIGLFIIPILFYVFITKAFGVDELEAGKWIGGGFTVVASLAWISTLLVRVVTKDMTYTKQLKDYENAVIAKRLEELDDDEVLALVEEVERDKF